MRASGVFADEEFLCDCCARVAVYKQHHDFCLSLGKMEGCGDFAARLVKWVFPGAFGSLGDLGGIGRLDEIVKGDDACSIGLFVARIFPNAAFAWL